MGGEKTFFITPADKEWVHQCFEWLTRVYGYPSPGFRPILFNNKDFPHTLSSEETSIEPLLTDLCIHFAIDRSSVSFETREDIRDSYGVPVQIRGHLFECELQVQSTENGDRYHLIFANSLLKHPKRLLFNSVFHFVQIRLATAGKEWVESDKHYFLYFLIGIFTRWGVILAQSMTDTGKTYDGSWERTWQYVSPMPMPVMVYSLALHAAMIEQDNPSWKEHLPKDMQEDFDIALDYIKQDPDPVISKQEFSARKLYREGSALAAKKNFEEAIASYQKALFLTSDERFKALLYHQTGYHLLLKGEFEKSIHQFQKSLETDPTVGYPYANMGFAFIMTGDTETGIYYQSLATGDQRIEAYALRNTAMYHLKRGEMDKARENFKKAFEHITIPVDWLEYLYARFLYDQGEKEEAITYLKRAVEKGEPQAINWMKELEKSF